MTAPTLDLPAAAALLHQHEHTVEAWARAGKVPAHRVGRRYVFITAELLAWIAAQPATRDAACRSTDAPAAATGGSSSARQARRRLENLLAPPTAPLRRNTTTAAPPNSGASAASASVLELHSRQRLPTG